MKKLIPALCALALILSSCSPGRDVTAAEDPRHPYIEEEACPLREGESLSFDPCEVTLFYPGESGPALGTAVCTVSVSEDVSLPAACINYLLSAYAGFPAGTRLTALYVCSGTALVCLSADALAFSGGHEGASLVYSVADTLLSLDGISRVAVTAGGRLLSPGVISSVVTDTHAVPAGADVRLSFRAAGGYLEPVALKGEALSLPGGITAEISDPFVLRNESNGKTTCAIVLLKNKINGHKATMADDYDILYEMVTSIRQQETLVKWIQEKQRTTYVRISEGWNDCDFVYPGWGKK